MGGRRVNGRPVSDRKMDSLGRLGRSECFCKDSISRAIPMTTHYSRFLILFAALLNFRCLAELPLFPLTPKYPVPLKELAAIPREEARQALGWPESQYIHELRILSQVDLRTPRDSAEWSKRTAIGSRYQRVPIYSEAYHLLMRVADEPTIRKLEERIEKVPRERGLDLLGCTFQAGDTWLSLPECYFWSEVVHKAAWIELLPAFSRHAVKHETGKIRGPVRVEDMEEWCLTPWAQSSSFAIAILKDSEEIPPAVRLWVTDLCNSRSTEICRTVTAFLRENLARIERREFDKLVIPERLYNVREIKLSSAPTLPVASADSAGPISVTSIESPSKNHSGPVLYEVLAVISLFSCLELCFLWRRKNNETKKQ
jgi:hypothetical protein